MRYETFAAQFRSELGDGGTKTLFQVRMAVAGMGYGTIVVAVLAWVISGPGIALWVWLVGWAACGVIAVIGFRRVLAKVSDYQG